MENRFDYRFDKRSKRITWVTISAVALVIAYGTYRYFDIGAYYPAWFLTFALAVGALYILSIPRSLRITDEALEIHCIVELTTIKLEDIRSVRRIANRRTGLWLLLGSYGFFGYYGYYLDWRAWQIVKMYASQWDNFVEIEDIYEQRYIVSCQDPDDFVKALSK